MPRHRSPQARRKGYSHNRSGSAESEESVQDSHYQSGSAESEESIQDSHNQLSSEEEDELPLNASSTGSPKNVRKRLRTTKKDRNASTSGTRLQRPGIHKDSCSSPGSPGSSRSPGSPRSSRSQWSSASESPTVYKNIYPDLSELHEGNVSVKYDDKKPAGDAAQGDRRVWIIVAVLITLLIPGIVAYLYHRDQLEISPPLDKRAIILESFTRELNKLKQMFPTQNGRLWSTLSSATKRIINSSHPTQPAVILIASSPTNQNLASCLARVFVDQVSKAHNISDTFAVNIASELSQLDPHGAKLILDKKMHKVFGDQGAVAGVLYGIQDLDGITAMLLHSFCDNDSAPYKKAVLVFTVYFDSVGPGSERQVEERLEAVWQNSIPRDDASALMSRVANNIVIVAPEENIATECT